MRRSTRTVTVFCILSLTTRPLSVRLFAAGLAGASWVVCSLIALSLGFLVQQGAHARDVAAHFPDLTRVRELLGRLLHAQRELRAQERLQLLRELVGRLASQFARFHTLRSHHALHEGRGNRQLRRREAESLFRRDLVDTVHLVEHLA